MSGVLSTLRSIRDDNRDDNLSSGNNSKIDTESVTSIIESSYDSDYSDMVEEYEETAEDREATEFLNNLLKNQSQKDGDFKRIESLLVLLFFKLLFIIIYKLK